MEGDYKPLFQSLDNKSHKKINQTTILMPHLNQLMAIQLCPFLLHHTMADFFFIIHEKINRKECCDFSCLNLIYAFFNYKSTFKEIPKLGIIKYKASTWNAKKITL